MSDIREGRMDPEIKRRWVEELRSGRRTQCSQWLRFINSDGTVMECVEGVLCDVVAPEGWLPPTAGNPGVSPHSNRRNSNRLPKEVKIAAGLGRYEPKVTVRGEHVTLTSLNDVEDYDFPALADLIETQL